MLSSRIHPRWTKHFYVADRAEFEISLGISTGPRSQLPPITGQAFLSVRRECVETVR
jgi:hypothetical protein